MGSNPLVMFIKKRKALAVSIAVIMMVAAWGVSYYVLLSQGNSNYVVKSKETMERISQINSNFEILTGKTNFLDGTSVNEVASFIDSSSKYIINIQDQFSDFKYTPRYGEQAKNIKELINQESSLLNMISQMVAKPLDFGNTKKMIILKETVSEIENLIYQIEIKNVSNKSNALEGMIRNLNIFLESKNKNIIASAYKIAQRELGGNIIGVIPFAFSDKNYLAVRRSTDQGNINYNVIILQSQGSDYIEIWKNKSELFLSNSDLQTKLFMVQDIDNDGNPDVTYFDQGSETGFAGGMLAIYSVAKDVEYAIRVSETSYYTKGSRQQIQVSDNLKVTENKVIYDWIKNTLVQNQIISPEITDQDMLADPTFAGDLWYKENVNLHGVGKAKIHYYDGDAPNRGIVTSEVRDGAMIYRAYFKDGVYAIDTQNKKFYVVYIPENQYDWIEKLELGENGIIMHARQIDDEPGVTYYFNTVTGELSKE